MNEYFRYVGIIETLNRCLVEVVLECRSYVGKNPVLFHVNEF